MTLTAEPRGTSAPRAGHGRHQRATHRAVAVNSTMLHFAVGDTDVRVQLPPLDHLAYYAGLTGAAVFGVIEWPIAVLAGVGHALSEDRRNRVLHALGEALDAV